MSKNNLLFLFFLLLLLGLAAEGTYYFLYQQAPQKTRAVTPSSTTLPQPTSVRPTIPKLTQPTQGIPPYGSLDQSTLDFLKTFKKDSLAYSIVNNLYQGTITEIEATGTSSATIKLKGDNGGSDTFEFPQELAKKVQIIKSEGEELRNLTFADLKVGDKIAISENRDLRKELENNLLGINITVF